MKDTNTTTLPFDAQADEARKETLYQKRRTLSDNEYRQRKIAFALSLVDIHPCYHCGNPVLRDYCCTHCGSGHPHSRYRDWETADQMMADSKVYRDEKVP